MFMKLVLSAFIYLAVIAALGLLVASPAKAQAPGTIIIMLDTDQFGEDNGGGLVEFEGDLGDFDLQDDESHTFTVEEGEFDIEIFPNPGWELELVECTNDDNVDVDIGDNEITITLTAGMTQHCTFHLSGADPTPTPTPTRTPTVTPTPAATQTPVTVIQTVVATRVVTATPVPVVSQPIIRAPNTGSEGLK